MTPTRARPRALLAVLLSACLAPLFGAEPVTSDERLVGLAAQYFAEVWRTEPTRATAAGLHDYDEQLGDFSATGYAARVAIARRYLARLDAIDPATYTADSGDDARILRARLESTLLALQAREVWRHQPATYTSAAAGAVFALLKRSFAPLPARMRLVIARERLMPGMFAEAKRNVTTVDAVTADLERRDMEGAVEFFGAAVPAALTTVKDKDLQAQFAASNTAALAALRDFISAMSAGPLAHPSGTYALGATTYAKMLELQELVPIDMREYERVGERALAQTKAQFVATARAIEPQKPPQAVAAALGADHPRADELLKKATTDLALLRTFVTAHHIVTLPADNDVRVVETPTFARQTTFASMDSPGPLERVATEAYYNVTPVEPGWPAERKEQHLSFFNNSYFPIISAHEVMPGHYVNFALRKHQKLSQIRQLISSPSFAEGWAHYDEQMIVDEGWGNGDPHVRLAQLQGALLRECRYLVGLREHTQGMSVAEATRFLQDNAFMAEDTARREALRGTQDPLYGYYTLGKLELLKLRDDYRKKLGDKFSLQRFHDEFLAHGDPPIAIVRKTMLGASDDGKLL